MRLLFLSITIPFPATDGGRLRVLNLLKQVAQRNRVTFLALETQPTDEEGIEYLRSLGIEAHLVSTYLSVTTFQPTIGKPSSFEAETADRCTVRCARISASVPFIAGDG